MKQSENTLQSTIDKCGENSNFIFQTGELCASLTEVQFGSKLLRRSLLPKIVSL